MEKGYWRVNAILGSCLRKLCRTRENTAETEFCGAKINSVFVCQFITNGQEQVTADRDDDDDEE